VSDLALLGESGEDARDDAGQTGSLRAQVGAFERALVAQALERHDGNQSAAARELQVSRVTLIDKLKKYGLLGR